MTAECEFRMVWLCEAKQSAVTQEKAPPAWWSSISFLKVQEAFR